MSKEKNLVKIKKSKNANTIFGLPAKSYIDENFWKKGISYMWVAPEKWDFNMLCDEEGAELAACYKLRQ